jgi:hypothetical protein
LKQALKILTLTGLLAIVSHPVAFAQSDQGLDAKYEWLKFEWWQGSWSGPRYDAIVDSLWSSLPFRVIQVQSIPSEDRADLATMQIDISTDGLVTKTTRYVGKSTQQEAPISLWSAGRISFMLELLMNETPQSEYDIELSHSSQRILTLWPSDGGEQIRIRDRGAQGPVLLWAVFEVVANLSTNTRWDSQ